MAKSEQKPSHSDGGGQHSKPAKERRSTARSESSDSEKSTRRSPSPAKPGTASGGSSGTKKG